MKIANIFLLLIPVGIFSQIPDKPQFGFSIRGVINILPVNKNWRYENEPKFNFRVSANAGIANRWATDYLYPSLNLEIQLYKGGIGGRYQSGNDEKFPYPFQLDAILAFTLTSGFINHHSDNYSHLRYFADFAAPSLRNPYKSSLSLGTNLVLTTDSKREFQRLGFLNVNIQGVQLSYYNDGGSLMRDLRLGDREDRYYTGGGTVSYDITDQNLPMSIELSGHKFTGYTKSAFEFSNEAKSKTVRYKDLDQYSYNKGVWRLNIYTLNNDKTNYGMSLSYYNSKKVDVQHVIHRITSDAYHIVLNKSYMFLEPIIMYNYNSK